MRGFLEDTVKVIEHEKFKPKHRTIAFYAMFLYITKKIGLVK